MATLMPWCISQSHLLTIPQAWTIDNLSHRRGTVSSLPFLLPESYTREGVRIDNTFILQLNATKSPLSMTIKTKTTCDASVIKLYIVTASGEKKCIYESPKNFTWTSSLKPNAKYKQSFTIDRFISRTELYKADNGYLPEDQLTIIVEFGFLRSGTNVPGTYLLNQQPQLKSIINSVTFESYGRLLATGKLSDVTLIVEGKVLRAHKAILAIRSPVLAAMFEGDTREAQESRVEITDIKADVFEQMLNFIYTGAMPSLDQQAVEELLVAADKYQVNSLKYICETYLCSLLSPQTAPNFFLFAEAINAPTLMNCARQFINNRAKDVFRAIITSESDQFMEMIRYLAAKNEEMDTAAGGE